MVISFHDLQVLNRHSLNYLKILILNLINPFNSLTLSVSKSTTFLTEQFIKIFLTDNFIKIFYHFASKLINCLKTVATQQIW